MSAAQGAARDLGYGDTNEKAAEKAPENGGEPGHSKGMVSRYFMIGCNSGSRNSSEDPGTTTLVLLLHWVIRYLPITVVTQKIDA
jgi:hypothetical protein